MNNSITIKTIKRNYSLLKMASKHLTTGDAFPDLAPSNPQKLVLLSMRFCPFAHRVHLMLERLRVPHHVVNIHLRQKPDWLTSYSLQGKVPALGLANEPGSPYLTESLLVADYLDEKYSAAGASLHPRDPLRKALDRLWIERFGSTVAPRFYRIAFGARPEGAEAVTELGEALDDLETELKTRTGGRFFAGATEPGMLDYMIWPWMERIAALQLFEEGLRFVLDEQRYPRLVAYQQGMLEDEAVKRYALAPDVHHKFMLSTHTGQPDFDMLLAPVA